MAKTVLALYRTAAQANAAYGELAAGLVDPDRIRVVTDAEGPSGVAAALESAGVPEPDRGWYSEGVRMGGTLVMASVPDAAADRAADALDAHGPEDLDDLARAIDSSTRLSAAPPVVPVSASAVQEAHGSSDDDHIRIIEEELELGTRQVDRGGIVVHRDVSVLPVEQTVSLNDEVVEVERRPADRIAAEGEAKAFEPGEWVFADTAEEVVVRKVPRVVEEIVIRKTRRTRQQQVNETVRRTEVKIEPRR